MFGKVLIENVVLTVIGEVDMPKGFSNLVCYFTADTEGFDTVRAYSHTGSSLHTGLILIMSGPIVTAFLYHCMLVFRSWNGGSTRVLITNMHGISGLRILWLFSLPSKDSLPKRICGKQVFKISFRRESNRELFQFKVMANKTLNLLSWMFLRGELILDICPFPTHCSLIGETPCLIFLGPQML